MKSIIEYINESIELTQTEMKVYDACKKKIKSLNKSNHTFIDNCIKTNSIDIYDIIDNLDYEDVMFINSIKLSKVVDNKSSIKKIEKKCLEYIQEIK